jgi:hypothetical protein
MIPYLIAVYVLGVIGLSVTAWVMRDNQGGVFGAPPWWMFAIFSIFWPIWLPLAILAALGFLALFGFDRARGK